MSNLLYGIENKSVKTTRESIKEYWENIIYEGDTGIDWDEGLIRCWRCGDKHKTNSLHRCHIIPRHAGGKDEPSNLILLCGKCHIEAPDSCSDPTVIWSWIKNTCHSTYGMYWVNRTISEFETIFKRPANLNNIKIDDLTKNMDDVGLHFNTISRSSLAYILLKSGA